MNYEEHQRLKRRLDYWGKQPPQARALRSQYLAALTEMDTAATCLRAVGDLLNPDPHSIEEKARDNIAVLMGLLLDHYGRARDAMAEAAQSLEDMQIEGGTTC